PVIVGVGDPGFRACRTDLDGLVRLQQTAERRDWSTRWTSVAALRAQVAPGPVLLVTFARQRTGTGDHVVRCLVVVRTQDASPGADVGRGADTDGRGDAHGRADAGRGPGAGEALAGGVVTLDVDPADLDGLPRLD